MAGREWWKSRKDREGGVCLEDFFFFPQLSLSSLPFCLSLVLTLQSLTEEGFKKRLVEVRQGWAWKRHIVRSHSSQMQTGAKSVAGGITPMNHAHCDAYPGWGHGKELGMAESYQLPIRNWSATGAWTVFPNLTHVDCSWMWNSSTAMCCYLSVCCSQVAAQFSIHARPPVCALPSRPFTQRSLW